MQRWMFSGAEPDRSSPKLMAGWAALGCFCLGALLGNCQGAQAGEPPGVTDAARWSTVEKGVIEDTRSGLQWTAVDNGSDINWNDARSFCISKRFHWRLPTLQELLSIYVAPPTTGAMSDSVACGQATCHTYVEFKLSGSWFWSSTPVGKDAYDGIEMAWGVQLINGAKTQSVMDLSEGSRAVCVRNR
jgi:hypothetical protein